MPQYLAMVIQTESGLFVASFAVESDDLQKAADHWRTENGDWPERILILNNGESHPVVVQDGLYGEDFCKDQAAWFINDTQVSAAFASVEEAQAALDAVEGNLVPIYHDDVEISTPKKDITVKLLE